MPIRPENRRRYPADWPAIVERVRERSEDHCEDCGVPNRVYRVTFPDGHDYSTECRAHAARLATDGRGRVARIVLTVAHLDHTPENCALENLRHWCQRCHNRYDAPERARGIRERRAMEQP